MKPVPRRSFLGAALAASAVWHAAASVNGQTASSSISPPRAGVTDTNVDLFRWPFRRLPLDETPILVEKLRALGVRQAWAGSFEGLLHRDIAAANRRLAGECRERGGGMLVPFGEINPMLPDWEEDLRRCHEEHGMPGVRLHPNYHGYRLSEPVLLRLLQAAGQRGLLVQIAVSMEDERTQHPLARVPHVELALLPELLAKAPGARVQVLNGFRVVRGQLLLKLAATERVFFEIATLEGAGGVANLLKQIPLDRVLFGSHAPFFYPEAAHLKMIESDLGEAQRKAIQAGNAEKLLRQRPQAHHRSPDRRTGS